MIGLGHPPRSRSLQKPQGGQSTLCTLHLATSPYRRFQSCSRLRIVRGHQCWEGGFGRREKRSALTMAQAVGSSAIVGEEIYRVVIHDVLWVLLGELGDRIPERRDRLHVFQHRKRETWMPWRLSFAKGLMGCEVLTVSFVVFLHEYERVVVDVAEVLDVGPTTPLGPTKARWMSMTHSTRQ